MQTHTIEKTKIISNLSALPVYCILIIFEYLRPQQIIELATINKAFSQFFKCSDLATAPLWCFKQKAYRLEYAASNMSFFQQFKNAYKKQYQNLGKYQQLQDHIYMIEENDFVAFQRNRLRRPEMYVSDLEDESLMWRAKKKNYQHFRNFMYKQIQKKFKKKKGGKQGLVKLADEWDTKRVIGLGKILYYAIVSEQPLDHIKELEKQGSIFEETYTYNILPIHMIAFWHHDSEVMQYVLSRYAKYINSTNKMNQTAIMYACNGGNHKLVECLLKKRGINLEYLSTSDEHKDWSALTFAAINGTPQCVELLLDYNLKQKKLSFSYGHIEDVFYKVLMGHATFDTLKVFLDKYNTLYASADGGDQTVLMYACYKNKITLLEYIFQQHDINFLAKTNDRGEHANITALQSAVVGKNQEIVERFLDEIKKRELQEKPEIISMIKTAYIYALQENATVKILDHFLQHYPVLLKETDDNGESVFEKILNSNDKYVEATKTLINRLLNYAYNSNLFKEKLLPRLQDLFLKLAEKGKLELMKDMAKYDNQFINCCDVSKQTALMFAAENNQIEVVKYLLENKAQLTWNIAKTSAFGPAAAHGCNEVIELLLAHYHEGLKLGTLKKNNLNPVTKAKLELIEFTSYGYTDSPFGMSAHGKSLAAPILRELVFSQYDNCAAFKERYKQFLKLEKYVRVTRLKNIYKILEEFLQEKEKELATQNDVLPTFSNNRMK